MTTGGQYYDVKGMNNMVSPSVAPGTIQGGTDLTTATGPDFVYAPLPQHRAVTRLLRLLPSHDKQSLIRCKILEYDMEPREEDHLYEALSYVWGDPNDTVEILLEDSVFRVTKNLHAALQHLRDSLLERVLWVDAVCINQRDNEEKASQIQFMASVYGYARQVIIWLGEANDRGDEALRHIHMAATDHHKYPELSASNQIDVLSLLRRGWFRRVWVLQEVALARSVLLMCGQTTLNGHAFCRGLMRLNLLIDNDSLLEAQIGPLAYLINGATLRSKYNRHSLGSTSLAELIDMYHDRDATVPLDRVFALLAMASDVPARERFRPNYNLTWEDVFEELVEYCLGSRVSVEILTRDMALVEGQGTLIGVVESIEQSIDRYDLQEMDVKFYDTLQASQCRARWGTKWILQRTAKTIEKADVVCFLEGASQPTLVRPSIDHFQVIIISVTPRQTRNTDDNKINGTIHIPHPVASSEHELSFFLRWHWRENLMAPDAAGEGDHHVQKFYEMARILNSMAEYETARSKIQSLLSSKKAADEELPFILASLDLMGLTYRREKSWDKAIEYHWSAIHRRREVQGIRHQATFESMTNLALDYSGMTSSTGWDTQVIRLTISSLQRGLAVSEKALTLLVHWGDMVLVELILDLAEGRMPMTTDLIRNIMNEHGQKGANAIELLLKWRKEDMETDECITWCIMESLSDDRFIPLFDLYGRKMGATNFLIQTLIEHGQPSRMETLVGGWESRAPLTVEWIPRAVRNPWFGQDQLESMLSQWTGEIHITDDLLVDILEKQDQGPEILRTLIHRPGGSILVTAHGLEAAARCEVNGVTVVKMLLDSSHETAVATTGGTILKITKNIIKGAVTNAAYGAELTKYLLERLETGESLTIDVVEEAAGNAKSGVEILRLLISHMGSEVFMTKEMLKRATQNLGCGYDVVVLLLDLPQPHIALVLDEGIVEAVASNQKLRLKIFNLLLQRVHNISVTERALLQCAKVGDAEMMDALIRRLGTSFVATDEIWIGLAGNNAHRRELLNIVLSHLGGNIVCSEAAILELFRQWDDVPLMLLFGRLGSNMTLTWNFVHRWRQIEREHVKAGSHYRNDGLWLETLSRDIKFTGNAFGMILEAYDIENIAPLFQRLGRDITVTGMCLESAATNYDGEAILRELLTWTPWGMPVTEKALRLAVRRGSAGALSLLLDEWCRSFSVPGWMAKKAAGSRDAAAKLKLIFGRSKGVMPNMNDVAEAAARSFDVKGLEYLLEHFPDEIQITDAMIEAAMNNYDSRMLTMIKDHKAGGLTITDNVIRTVRRADTLRWLFEHCGDAVPITANLMTAINTAHNIAHGVAKDMGLDGPDLDDDRTALLKAALAQCQLDLPVSEDTLVELARSFSSNEVSLFLDQIGNKFQLTRRMVCVSGPNESRPDQVLWVFLTRLHDEAILDHNVVLEIAENYDEDVMAYLFSRWGESLKITKDTIKAVANNSRRKQVMELMLEHACNELSPLGNSVIEAVLAHLDHASGLMRQLLVQLGRDIATTKQVEFAQLIRSAIKQSTQKVATVLIQPAPNTVDKELLSLLEEGRDLVTLASKFDQPEGDAKITEEMIVLVARQGTIQVQRFILNRLAEDIEITGAIIEAAADGGDNGKRFLKRCLLLINQLYGRVQITQEALFQAAKLLESEMVRFMLDVSNHEVSSVQPLLEAASENEGDAEKMASMLLSRVSCDTITEDAVVHVARLFPADLTALALTRKPMLISNRMIEAAAANCHGTGVLKLLFDYQHGDALVTEKTVEAAAGNSHAVEVLRYLLERGAQAVRITEAILTAAAANIKPAQVLEFITDHWADQLHITESIMQATVSNPCLTGLVWLVNRYAEALPITDELFEAAARRTIHDEDEAHNTIDGEHIVFFLLRLREESMPVTEKVMKAVVQVPFWHKHSLRDFLDRHKRFHLTEDVLRAAIGTCHLKRLLKIVTKAWRETAIPAEVLLEIAVQDTMWRGWKKSIKVVLHRKAHDEPISEAVIQAAAKLDKGAEVLGYLCDQRGDDIHVTEGVMSAAAAGRDAQEVLRFISRKWGAQELITEKVLKAAAGSPKGKVPLEEIVVEWGRKLPVTVEVVKAAAGNANGEDVLHLIARYWGELIEINEGVMEAAAGNTGGSGALRSIVDRWGTAVPITEKVVEAAAGNPKGKDVLLLMIWRWGKNLPITDAAMKAARENPNSRDILALIAERWASR